MSDGIEKKRERIIISLGGSILVPDEIDCEYIRQFKTFIEGQIEKGFSFILVTGGGRTARRYIEAAAKVTLVADEDKDWLGIHATRLNAHLIRTIFREHAHPRINTNPHDMEDFYAAKEPILVAAGWRPGSSTDYVAVLLGKYLEAKRVINLSNIDHVYDKDPSMHADAKQLDRMTWTEFRTLVGDEWTPGLNTPFDPVASKLAETEGMEVAIMLGRDLENMERYLDGQPFEGTVIGG